MSRRRSDYEVRLLHGPADQPDDANVDVVVEFRSGRRFSATFFTLVNVERLMREYQASGECAQGRYFWSADMILVREVTAAEVEAVVSDLIATNEFYKAFRELQ